QAGHERPDDARPVRGRQLAVEVDHLPAQLPPLRTQHPRTLAHGESAPLLRRLANRKLAERGIRKMRLSAKYPSLGNWITAPGAAGSEWAGWPSGSEYAGRFCSALRWPA